MQGDWTAPSDTGVKVLITQRSRVQIPPPPPSSPGTSPLNSSLEWGRRPFGSRIGSIAAGRVHGSGICALEDDLGGEGRRRPLRPVGERAHIRLVPRDPATPPRSDPTHRRSGRADRRRRRRHGPHRGPATTTRASPATAGSSPSSCARPRPPSDRGGAAPYASSRAATSRAVPASVTRVLTSRARAAPTIALALSAPTEIPTTCGMRRIRSGVMPSSRGSSG